MTEINAETRLCGLIGNPVRHSVSPLIHNQLSRMLGINMAYVTFPVEERHVEAAVKGAFALDILGLNVTVPHKQNVIPYLEEVDSIAKAVGAVNTLVRTENGYKGYNTDITGFHRSLMEENIAIDGENIILLGAGGASRAIAFLLGREGAAKVYLLNRSVGKAEDIAGAVNGYFGRDVIIPMELSEYRSLPNERYFCIQTTSVGLHPHDNDVVIDDVSFYAKIHTGVDIIYNPYETRFMKEVKKAGGRAVNGMKMLLWQGVAAYELWNGVSVSTEQADSVFELMKRKLGQND